MTKTEELLKLAEAATPGPWKFVDGVRRELHMPSLTFPCQMCDEQYYPWTPDRIEDWQYIAAANPTTIRKMVELVRLQNEVLIFTQQYVGDKVLPPIAGWSWFDAIAAYERFEKGEG